ncbi:hypothetical protein RDI58_029540 [Solanum bulbocastanum]|uniref:F-box associated beta-propeller type 1 domain-containing protein n=1 Tax=Solanum bulbocastanum TaxID=147425 RepID=A0AAN8SWU4_SOLBU
MDVPQPDSSSTASLVESPVPIDQLRVALPNTQYFSSNGILLIIYVDDIIVTRESRRIRSPIRSKCDLLYSFCYFPRIDEYKIFRVGTRLVNGDMNDMEIDIFSTKSNIWKSIGPFSPNYYYYGSNVVMADGIVHMTARRTDNLISCTILSFCLEKEQFHDELLCPYTIEGKDKCIV